MADEQASSRSDGLLVDSCVKVAGVAFAALLVAALPHFFLHTPLEFYAQERTAGWLGLTVWAPTFLGAVALFLGADATARTEEPMLPGVDLRMAAGVTVPVAALVALAAINLERGALVDSWSTLSFAMFIHGATLAVGVFFWQAFVQRHLLEEWAPLMRPVAVTIAGVLLWVPFLANHSWEHVAELILEHGILYLAIALLFEFGLPVYACMGTAIVMGAAWAWAHHMIFV